VARSQASVAKACTTNAAANDEVESIAICALVGVATMISAGTKNPSHRGDGEPYGERPDHPLPMQARPSGSDM
jgi:hypothetical protein